MNMLFQSNFYIENPTFNCLMFYFQILKPFITDASISHVSQTKDKGNELVNQSEFYFKTITYCSWILALLHRAQKSIQFWHGNMYWGKIVQSLTNLGLSVAVSDPVSIKGQFVILREDKAMLCVWRGEVLYSNKTLSKK